MCFFYQADISYFLFFGSYLRSQLGSSLQKCNLDKCDQNLHKRRLCFFTQQTFPIFIPLAVTWGPNFDFCCKNVIMACAIKIHINKVCVFSVQHTFSIFMSLAVARGPNLAPCCKSVVLTSTIKNHIKIIYVPFT